MNSKLLMENDQANAPEITAHFYISGRDFDPLAITNFLRIEPSEVWRQHRSELIERPDLPTVCWKYGFKKKRFISIDDAISELLEVIWPLRDCVQQWLVSNAAHVGVECSVSIYNDRPIYELSKTTISKLSELDCEFLLDIFDYSNDDYAEE